MILNIFLFCFGWLSPVSEDFPCKSIIKESVTNTVKRLGKKHHEHVFPYHSSRVLAASGLKLYKWKLVWFMSKTIYKISHKIHRETRITLGFGFIIHWGITDYSLGVRRTDQSICFLTSKEKPTVDFLFHASVPKHNEKSSRWACELF